jgi:hypothetical protein
MSDEERIDTLERKLFALRNTTATLIAWMAGSANSPIRPDEAGMLIKALDALND